MLDIGFLYLPSSLTIGWVVAETFYQLFVQIVLETKYGRI
jgi:hypothetical protein